MSARDSYDVAARVVGFAKLLRAVGISVGTDATVLAVRAVSNLSAGDSVAFFWVLQGIFVSRHSEQDIFNQAFGMYWMHSGAVSDLLGSAAADKPPKDRQPMFRRLRDALSENTAPPMMPESDDPNEEMTGTYSDIEVLRHMDFAMMSEAEFRLAKREIAEMRMPCEERKTRRFKQALHGTRVDVRRTMKEMAVSGGDMVKLSYKRRIERRVPLVVLCDISGSMENYARILVHFLYFLANDRDRVNVFLFGTRLSNITQRLKDRDPDRAISRVSTEVNDWAGGTRIGASLREFNKKWSRRLLGHNATVLILTDGLERGDGTDLEKEVWRLKARSRRLIWLNPLTGYAQYEPAASGAKILSKHVNLMLPCHNLESLRDLAGSLHRESPLARHAA